MKMYSKFSLETTNCKIKELNTTNHRIKNTAFVVHLQNSLQFIYSIGDTVFVYTKHTKRILLKRLIFFIL